MSESYENCTVGELKHELRKLGAKVTGRKSELLERVRAYKRNFVIEEEEEISNESNFPSLPDISTYKDLTTNCQLPSFTAHFTDAFMESVDHRIPVSAVQMYFSEYLLLLRFVKLEDLYFIKGQCKAEMTKSATYYADVVLDGDGSIRNSQCECVAGQGPLAHCKHICVILLALEDLNANKTLKIQKTCTEKKQSFHKPSKPYKGSPVKASALPLQVYERKGEKRNRQENVVFDPRPKELVNQEGYSDYVLNLAIGFNLPGDNKIPIVQLRKPANIQAIWADHDYLKKPLSDIYLEKIGVTYCTFDYAEHIENTTRNQSKSPIWKKERCFRLCSSNFSKVCKLTRADPVLLAKSFTTYKPIKAKAILHGKKYEKEALQKYSKEMNVQVKECGMFINPDFPFLCSSPDGIVNEDTVLEIKCPYTAFNKMIWPTTVPYLEFRDGELTLKKSHDYYFQIQGQLLVTNRKIAHLFIYTESDFQVCIIRRDEEFIHEMFTKLYNFFQSYFKPAFLEKCIGNLQF